MLSKNKLLLFTLFSVLLIVIGAVYEQVSRANALATFKANGVLVDLGSRALHLDCRGDGSPIIVLESGLDTLGSLSWSAVHDELAKISRTCAYDRAGIMWSAPRPDSNDLMLAIAKDLNKGLTLAGEQPPYVLVGHSFGGPYITQFTALYGDKVAGIVFIDSPHPEQMDLVQDLEVPVMLAMKTKLQDVFNPWFNELGITRALAVNSQAFTNQSQHNASAVAAFYPSSETTLAKELANYSLALKQVDELRNFADRPMFVLANIVNYKEMTEQQLVQAGITRELVPAVMEQDLYMFNNQASWSSTSQIKLLHNTSHYIQFDRPAEVVNAVQSVVSKVKAELDD